MMSDLRADLEPLLQWAALAPSSGNAQPWHVQMLAGRDASAWMPGTEAPSLLISVETRVSDDLTQRDLWIDVGCFSAILLNLLRLSGHRAHPYLLAPSPQNRWYSENGWPREAAVLITLPHWGDPWGQDPYRLYTLTTALEARKTQRGAYDRSEPLRFIPEARWLPFSLSDAPRGLRWHRIDDRNRLDAVAELLEQQASPALLSADAWGRIYRQLRFQLPDPQATASVSERSGVLIDAMCGERLRPWQRRWKQWAWHPALLPALVPWLMQSRLGKSLARSVHDSTALLCLCSTHPPEQSASHQGLVAGESIANAWLHAAIEGQALHPLSATLRVDAVAQHLESILGTHHELLFIARAGTPLNPVRHLPRLRRSPAEFCPPHPAIAEPAPPPPTSADLPPLPQGSSPWLARTVTTRQI